MRNVNELVPFAVPRWSFYRRVSAAAAHTLPREGGREGKREGRRKREEEGDGGADRDVILD